MWVVVFYDFGKIQQNTGKEDEYTMKKITSVVLCSIWLLYTFFSGDSVKAAELNNTNRVHFITLEGSTDAILLESNGRFGMVDSGEDTDFPDGSDERYPFRKGIAKGGYEDEVIEYMKAAGVTEDNLDFYLGTHPHSDHIGSADEIIREFKPERVYIMEYKDEYISSENNLWDNLYVYDHMLEAAREVNAVLIQNFDESAPVTPIASDPIENQESPAACEEDAAVYGEDVREYVYYSQEEIMEKYGADPTNPDDPQAANSLKEGEKVPVMQSDDPNSTVYDSNVSTTANPNFTLGDMEIHVVNYSDDYKTIPKPDANYFSLGVLVEINGYRMFLAGDIGNYDGDEDRLALWIGKVDVLKLGHHGYSSSNTLEYLNTLQPNYAIVTGKYKTLTAAKGRMEILDALAEKQGGRLYTTYDYAPLADGIILTFQSASIESNVPTDQEILLECFEAPHVVCYKDGKKYKINGEKVFHEKEYWFDNSAEACCSKWLYRGKKWYYYKEDGMKATGFLVLKGKKYYLDPEGVMQTGWQTVDGKRYYFKEDGAAYVGWKGTDYFNKDGVWIANPQKEGWRKDSAGWWWRYPDGTYPRNQWKLISGKYYYFNARGYMQTGWLYKEKIWYYLADSGAMTAGWQKVGNKWYFMNSRGEMQTGWQKINGKWYYFADSGAMAVGWQGVNRVWYYLADSGAMTVGWQKVGNVWYYMNGSGAMQTGWQRINGKWYYMESSGAMAVGWKKIQNEWYYLDANGVMQTGWVNGYYLNSSGVWIEGLTR